MKYKVLVLFCFLCAKLFSQKINNDSLLISFYTNDSVLYKASIKAQKKDTTISIYIKNVSLRNIYIDTTYIIPSTWRVYKSNSPNPIGIEFEHLGVNYVNEGVMNAFILRPNSEIKINYNFQKIIGDKKPDDIKYYSFELRYLLEESIDNEIVGKETFEIPKISYYLLSKHYMICNCDVEFLRE